MKERDAWEGSASELLDKLVEAATEEKIDTNAKSWPKAAHVLSRRLNEVKTNLAEIGLNIETQKKSGGKRTIVIRKAENSVPSATLFDGGDSGTEAPHEATHEDTASESTEDASGDSGATSYDSSLPF